MENIDHDYLLDLFAKREDADEDAMRRYYEGRIDGHCLQNAISEDDLVAVSAAGGYRVTWETAMAVVGA